MTEDMLYIVLKTVYYDLIANLIMKNSNSKEYCNYKLYI